MRWVTAVFFIVYVLALTFPGYALFNHIRPLVLGLPFSFFWVVLWVALGWAMLALLHHSERRRRGG